MARSYLTRAVHEYPGHTRRMSDSPFAANVRRVAKAKGRSIRSVSLEAGMSESGLKHMLAGRSRKPGYMNVKAIADVLGVTVPELTGSLDDAPPPLERKPSQLIEDQTKLHLLAYWDALPVEERRSLFNIIRKSALGE